MSESVVTPDHVASALRSPFVPEAVTDLARAGGFLDAVWPQLASSVDTAGFRGSALYMADMSADGVEEVYRPVLSRDSLLAGALSTDELDGLVAVLDAFHWIQPQVLLLVAALSEAMAQPSVGGQGRPEPRDLAEREREHLATTVDLVSGSGPPFAQMSEVLGVDSSPQLYRAVAVWPSYLDAVWEELQHLAAYPDFRRRGRALYFYARSSTRFLAQPLHADPEALRERGMADADIDAARNALDRTLPVLATMMMHCSAMRVGLGITTREVVVPG